LLELAVGIDGLLDNKVHHACLFSKKQAYGFLSAMERVVTAQSHYDLNPPSSFIVTSLNKITDDKNIRSLRLGLLGIFSGAIIQENADSGYTRTKANEIARVNKSAEFEVSKAPIERRNHQNVLEMLSTSASL
jgi:hypothetical protein